MGPSECIGSTFQKYNRPKQSNRQQHPPMQWAHPNASAVPPRNLMGPSKVIGSSIANAMGPSECIGSASQKIKGQIEDIWRRPHLRELAPPYTNKMGQRKVIGSSICQCNGAIQVH